MGHKLQAVEFERRAHLRSHSLIFTVFDLFEAKVVFHHHELQVGIFVTHSFAPSVAENKTDVRFIDNAKTKAALEADLAKEIPPALLQQVLESFDRALHWLSV